jgi:heme exporter protein C
MAYGFPRDCQNRRAETGFILGEFPDFTIFSGRSGGRGAVMVFIKLAAILLITVVIVAAFVTPPPLASMPQGGEASRIFYFHVPMAQTAFLSFLVAAVYAIAYLRTRRVQHDHLSATSAELGLIFSIVAMITGAIWAKQAWGAYWNWDPRQLFLFVLILFYGAFFALRQAVVQADARRRLSSVYLIFGGAISPFLFFVLPRMYQSLHEDANQVVMSPQAGSNMSSTVATFFITSTIGFVCLYVWMLKLGVQAARIEEGRS